MSTLKKDKQRIEELIELLDDDSLRRSHKSVGNSVDFMFQHVDDLDKSGMDDDIKDLLGAYRTLAERYYTQFELSLLEEIKENKELQIQIQPVVNKFDVDDEDNRLIRVALVDKKKMIVAEQEEIIRKFPLFLQDALDKLRDEWQRLETIAVTSRPNLNLKPVVKFAAYSVGIQDKNIVVVSGRQFALYFFSYLENFAVLTVPIYSVAAPWDWSIFWHELAGYQVYELEKSETLTRIEENLVKIHELYSKSENDTEKGDLLSIYTNDLEGCKGYLGELFIKDLDLKDLGNFEYQFEQISLRLTPQRKDRFVNYESMKRSGWNVDWIKELFEDAFSILTFREEFLVYFEDILSRYDKADDRHPPKEIRLRVAQEILNLANDPNELGRSLPQDEEKINRIVARQVFKLVTLMLAASRYQDSQSADLQEKRKAQQYFSKENLKEGLETIEGWVKDQIKKWKEKVGIEVSAENPENSTGNDTNALTSFINGLPKSQPSRPSYKLLYKDKEEKIPKNYLELLALSFFDVDFGTATVIDVSYRTKPKFSSASLRSIPVDVTLGDVRYVDGKGHTRRTSLGDWNVSAASSAYRIQP